MKKVLLLLLFFVVLNESLAQKNCLTSRFEYLENNSDIKKIGLDPWGHYQSYGKKEGRIWPVCSDDDSLLNLQLKIESLDSIVKALKLSLEHYYSVNGVKWRFDENTIDTYLAFQECQVYYIESDYYQKKKNIHTITLGGIPMNMGIESGNRYFGINSKNLFFVYVADDIFQSGKGTYGRNGEISITSKVFLCPNDSLYRKFNGVEYIGYTDQKGARTIQEYCEKRDDFFKKLFSEIKKNNYIHPLSESQKKEWLTKATNLDDNYFKIIEELSNANSKLEELNEIKSRYIVLLIENRKQEESRIKAKLEEDRLAKAFEIPGLVKIGKNYWQRKNCSITKYMNGDPIYFAQNMEQLYQANQRKEGAYCFVNFNNRLDSNSIVYNYYAIMDPRGFGTSELRIPNMQDWEDLFNTLEKDKKNFNDLKEITEWGKNNNIPLSNYYGFGGIPTFYGFASGMSWKNLNNLSFWIPDSYVSYLNVKEDEAYIVEMDNSFPNSKNARAKKENVFPVRLVKGEVTYFDGKVVQCRKEGPGKLNVRTPSNRVDYVNGINVQPGVTIVGNWTNNKIEGRSQLILSDGTSTEGLFINNNHQGEFILFQNITQKCIYDGKTFNSRFKKSTEEIEYEKSLGSHVNIKAYKTELYCNSTCESKARAEAESARIAREKNAQNQSSNFSLGSPNAHQCDKCLYLSMGNSKPGAFAFGGCSDKSGHYWKEVNTNCEYFQGRNNHMFKNTSCGLQCSECGAKSFIFTTLPFGGKCPKAEFGSHKWKEF
jgi:uncharacterized protein (TIGR02145 family)